jgi:predicted nucleotidyltransferase
MTANAVANEELAERLGRLLKRDARVLALFVEGSLARGDADAFSDLDLILVGQPEHRDSLAALCRGYLEQCQAVVYWKADDGAPGHLHGITADWARCDFRILSPAALKLRGRAGLAVIWDRARIGESLAAAGADAERPLRVAAIVDEFIRLLGLLHVVLGRQEILLGVRHAGLLRDQLTALLLEADGAPGGGAALRLDSYLSESSRHTLAALPAVSATRASIIEAHAACARAFLPRARALTRALDLPWPEIFLEATRRLLRDELDLALPEDDPA